NRVHIGPKDDVSLETLATNSSKIYRIEEVPSDELNLLEDEMLVPVAHFYKDVFSTFGIPFLFKMKHFKFAIVVSNKANFISESPDYCIDLSDFKPHQNQSKFFHKAPVFCSVWCTAQGTLMSELTLYRIGPKIALPVLRNGSEVSGRCNRVHIGPKDDVSLETLATNSSKIYRIEEVPSDELNLLEDEMLVPVAHFYKDVFSTFGIPFLFKMKHFKFAIVVSNKANFISESPDYCIDLSDFKPHQNQSKFFHKAPVFCSVWCTAQGTLMSELTLYRIGPKIALPVLRNGSEVSGRCNRVHIGPKDDVSLETLATNSSKIYRIEEVPSDELNLLEDEMLVPVAHFYKDVFSTFGIPFLFKMKHFKFAIVVSNKANFISESPDYCIDLSDFKPHQNQSKFFHKAPVFCSVWCTAQGTLMSELTLYRMCVTRGQYSEVRSLLKLLRHNECCHHTTAEHRLSAARRFNRASADCASQHDHAPCIRTYNLTI
ncbi:unnamed protein product, partial [Trichogramma brassicae]